MNRVTAGEIAISLNGLKEKHNECETRHDKEIDDIKVKAEKTKVGIYDKIEETESSLNSKIKGVSNDVVTLKDNIEKLKWSVVKWIFIIISGQTILEKIWNFFFKGG